MYIYTYVLVEIPAERVGQRALAAGVGLFSLLVGRPTSMGLGILRVVRRMCAVRWVEEIVDFHLCSARHCIYIVYMY